MIGRGVLFVNLGSPASPSVEDVRRYLNEFLMDEHVIDLPWLIRRLLLSLFILPIRSPKSAKAYQSIWSDSGSPLISYSQSLTNSVKQQLDLPVELAMRYGKPDMETAIERLVTTFQVEELLLFPLYPHYAASTVKTVVLRAQEIIKANQFPIKLKVSPVFYDDEAYIAALVESAAPWLEKDYDHLVFSFHGLPVRHIVRGDPTGSHCLKKKNCCAVPSTAHQTCYRHQIYRTAASFVESAGIAPDKYSVAFQSRLGRAEWLTPNTEDVLKQLAANGNQKVLVICPSFVSDCLGNAGRNRSGGKRNVYSSRWGVADTHPLPE